MKWWAGLVALGAGAAAGAAIGALANKPCVGPASVDTLFCGPKWGAVEGAVAGVLLVGVAGVGALFSDSTRAAGLTAALPVGAIVAAAAVSRA